MASELLQQLIAQKRAAPYSPEQSLEVLRTTGPDDGRVPRAGTAVEETMADGVAVEWVTHDTPTSDGILVYLHGGGYYRSSAIASRRIASDLSQACGCRCLTVEYRLAPEHPFPAGIEDTLTVYRWLLRRGYSPAQIVIGGCSAGGGLTAALFAKLKQTGEPLPAAGVLLSPWTDLTQSHDSYSTNAASDPVISKAYLDRASAWYLADTSPTDPLASPMFSDLADLPPLLVQVGEPEVMRDDALAYAAKARASGVHVILETYPDVVHGWQDSDRVIPDIPEAVKAREQIGAFFRQHTSA